MFISLHPIYSLSLSQCLHTNKYQASFIQHLLNTIAKNCYWFWGHNQENGSLQSAWILHHWDTWPLMACDTWHYVIHQSQNRLKLVLYGKIQNFQKGLQLTKLE